MKYDAFEKQDNHLQYVYLSKLLSLWLIPTVYNPYQKAIM